MTGVCLDPLNNVHLL